MVMIVDMIFVIMVDGTVIILDAVVVTSEIMPAMVDDIAEISAIAKILRGLIIFLEAY